MASQIPGLFPVQTVDGVQTSGTQSSDIFDIGFTRFITPLYISFLWCIALIVEFLSYVGGLFSIAYQFGMEWMLVWSIPATLGMVIVLFYTRLHYEKIVIKFKSEEHLKKIEEYLRVLKERAEK